MPELPLPKFTRQRRPELSLDEILAKGREAAAAEGLIITGDTPPPVEQPTPEPQAPPAAPPATGPSEQERQEPVASPAANAGASSGRRPKRSKATARISEDQSRVI